MPFYDSCPDDYTVRRDARRDAERDQRFGDRGRRNPYDCDDANRSYERTYRRERDVHEERAADERREDERQLRAEQDDRERERRVEEDYWRREREAEEEALAADEEEASDGDSGVIF